MWVLLVLFQKESIYLGLAVATVIFSAASGLNEALISPIVAELPSENPEREMSKLHSMYAWGVVGVVILSTLFLSVFGGRNWMYLALLWSIAPFVTFLMFSKGELCEKMTTLNLNTDL